MPITAFVLGTEEFPGRSDLVRLQLQPLHNPSGNDELPEKLIAEIPCDCPAIDEPLVKCNAIQGIDSEKFYVLDVDFCQRLMCAAGNSLIECGQELCQHPALSRRIKNQLG